MDDHELDQRLDDASRRWRAGAPPLDAIWDGVEAELGQSPAVRRTPGWFGVAIAAGVALVIGVAGGRLSVHSTAPTRPPVAAAPASSLPVIAASDDEHHAMGELLGRTAVLLAALPRDSGGASVSPEITHEGARLLTTTRQLLDSPSGSDRRLRPLLQDLELVLAQVARLEPRDPQVEMQFIQTTLDEHDLVPRLRSAAADLSLDDEF